MEKDLLLMGSDALRKSAMNKEVKEYVLSNPILFKTLKKAAERYIGGENLDETILKVIKENKEGFKCSIEFMGENTSTVKEANDATKEFIRVIREIKSQHLNSTISLDLSHIGLAISKEICFENLSEICKESQGIEVIISAEGVDRTDDVIEIYKKGTKEFDDLSIWIFYGY